MALGSGLGSQIGIANETTPGTAVAVTTFTRYTSETVESRPNLVQGYGLGGGALVPQASRRTLSSADGGGQVTFDLPTKGLGKWVQAMMGSYSTTATQLAATAAYQQIHNIGSPDGKTFTLQKGDPTLDGTVNPFTFAGCKVTDWTLTSSPNSIVNLQVTVDAMTQGQTAGGGALGLQTASYSASTATYAFQQANVQTFSAMSVVSGVWTPTSPTAVPYVRNISVKGGQPKDTARWVAGSTSKAEAVTNDYQPITGQIDVDFSSLAHYTEFINSTSTGLAITFTGANIASTYFYTFQLVMPAVFWENGSTPKVGGPGVITVQYPFTALDDGTNGALQCYIISTDTTV